MSPLDDKEMLMKTDPETFWETPHYAAGPPCWSASAAPIGERIELVIQRAWWDRASKAQRKAFGPRP